MRSLRTPRRARTDTAPPGRVIAGALVVAAILAVLATVAARSPSEGIPGQDLVEFRIQMPDVGNLRPRNEVRIGGVRVGQVLTVKLVDGRPTADLQVKGSTLPLPADTRVSVRAKGLLGARYVQLVPGTGARSIREGGLLVETGALSLTNDVPTALSTFDPATRKGLGDLIDGLGRGVLGRSGDLRELLRDMGPDAVRTQRIARELLADDTSVDRLLPALAAGTEALDASREEIARGLDPAADVFGTLGASRGDLEATLTDSPPALRSTTRGTTDSVRLLASLRDLAEASRRTLPEAPATLRSATRLLRDSREPIKQASELLDAVPPAVGPTLELTGELRPTLDPVQRALDRIDPMLEVIGPYGCDLDGFGSNWRSMLGFGLPNPDGKPQDKFRSYLNNLRLEAIASPDDLIAGSGPGLRGPLRKNAYPAPCTDPTQHTP